MRQGDRVKDSLVLRDGPSGPPQDEGTFHPIALNDAAVGLIFRSGALRDARQMMRARLVETDQVALEHMHLTFAPTKRLI
jgi:hypothetical protein